MFHDGQSQARASQGAGAFFADPIEAFEDSGPVFPGDSATVVDAGQACHVSCLGGGDGDALASAVFQGVMEKISDGLGEAASPFTPYLSNTMQSYEKKLI